MRHGNKTTISNLYYKLQRLEKQKLIRPFTISYSKTLWTLHKTGFELIRSELPQMDSVGFKSEHPIHDHLVTAVHLGDWVQSTPPGTELISEQQLRRLTPDLFPKYFPKSKIHRSDGYWILPVSPSAQPRIVALEVERNPKSLLAYQRTFDFYDEEKSITEALWLITSNSVDRRIKNILASDTVLRKSIHFLIAYKDYVTQGWLAKAENVYGQISTPRNILFQNQFKTDSKLLQNQIFKSLLDLRKFPIESKTSIQS